MNLQNRQGYLLVEALIAMLIVSFVLGGTLTSITTASSFSQGNKRQITELILCEELMENLRQQWLSSPDPLEQILNHIDPEEQYDPLTGMGWRKACVRCPWPAALDKIYTAQYKIQPLLSDINGQPIKRVRPGTLFQLQVRVQAINQSEMISLFTFLPLIGTPVNE